MFSQVVYAVKRVFMSERSCGVRAGWRVYRRFLWGWSCGGGIGAEFKLGLYWNVNDWIVAFILLDVILAEEGLSWWR